MNLLGFVFCSVCLLPHGPEQVRKVIQTIFSRIGGLEMIFLFKKITYSGAWIPRIHWEIFNMFEAAVFEKLCF